jgi:phosphatidylserine decarboxylase precursor
MEIFNRYSQKLETEHTPCAQWLSFLYKTCLGRILLHLFFKRVWVSRCIGFFMNRPSSKKRIVPFCETYHIDVTEFEKAPEDYENFNNFFCRKLKPGARTFNTDMHSACFPADARHLGFQNIDTVQNFFIKGSKFNLSTLLGSQVLAEYFQGGSCVISRLAPVDYHRFHFPCSGIPQKSQPINGSLFSVHPLALAKSLKILGENKRCITILDSEVFGKIALLEVGATCVGSIQQTYIPGKPIVAGEEKGYFAFGGSTVITLFQYKRIALAEDLLHFSQQGIELYAHVGDFMGKVCG